MSEIKNSGLTDKMADEMNEMLINLSMEGYIVHFGVIGMRSTYCWIKSLQDGWERVEMAYTKDPMNFDYLLGRYWALKGAYDSRADRTEN